MTPGQNRSRAGCWTCRRRKKKCDGRNPPPCGNCERLGIVCEGYSVRLVWEDASVREGMRQRGPRKRGAQTNANATSNPRIPPSVKKDRRPSDSVSSDSGRSSGSSGGSSRSESPPDSAIWDMENDTYDNPLLDSEVLRNISAAVATAPVWQPSLYNFSSIELFLLNHYLQNLVPKDSVGTNQVMWGCPMLKFVVPLAMTNEMVRCAFLTISGVAAERMMNDPTIGKKTLELRARSLKGLQELLDGEDCPLRSRPGVDDTTSDGELQLIATTTQLMVYEEHAKLGTWKWHLNFTDRIFEFLRQRERSSRTTPERRLDNEHARQCCSAVYQIFLYYKLVAVLFDRYHLGTSHASLDPERCADFNEELQSTADTHYFPNLLVRINRGEPVTMDEIDAWDGSMEWLPTFWYDTLGPDRFSYSITKADLNDKFQVLTIVSLYRTTAKLYLYQKQLGAMRMTTIPWAEIFKMDRGQTPYPQGEMAELTRSIMSLFRLIPEGSSFEIILAWPLQTASMFLTSQDDKDYVFRRSVNLQKRTKMSRVRRFRDRMAKQWNGEKLDETLNLNFAALLLS